MLKKKVFISYDFDNDKALKDFIIGQAKNSDSPFEVIDHSLKEAAPERDWLERATSAIGRADVFIIMLGSKTASARGAIKELKVAIQKDKPRFQIIGYQNGTENWALLNGGRVYRWTWDNLKNLLR